MRDYSALVETARVHYENLKTDIENAHSRAEHIRLTALAQEAHNLLTDLITFEVGLVYTHTNGVDISKYVDRSGLNPLNSNIEPLDLPEFKSPYNPDA